MLSNVNIRAYVLFIVFVCIALCGIRLKDYDERVHGNLFVDGVSLSVCQSVFFSILIVGVNSFVPREGGDRVS